MSGKILIFVYALTVGPRLRPVSLSHWSRAPAWDRSLKSLILSICASLIIAAELIICVMAVAHSKFGCAKLITSLLNIGMILKIAGCSIFLYAFRNMSNYHCFNSIAKNLNTNSL